MGSNQIVRFPDVESDLPPLIPEGEYQLKLVSHATVIQFKTPRLALKFSIVDYNEYHGTVLYRYYNVVKLTSKAGTKGSCKHKARGDFMIDYCTLLPNQHITRLDRVPMEPLYQTVIVGKVRTVKRNNQQRVLPEQLQYSVVDSLLRVSE